MKTTAHHRNPPPPPGRIFLHVALAGCKKRKRKFAEFLILSFGLLSLTTSLRAAASVSSGGSSASLSGGTAGSIPYQSGAGVTSYVAPGTTGEVLTSNGTSAPTWETASGGGASSLPKLSSYTLTPSNPSVNEVSTVTFSVTTDSQLYLGWLSGVSPLPQWFIIPTAYKTLGLDTIFSIDSGGDASGEYPSTYVVTAYYDDTAPVVVSSTTRTNDSAFILNTRITAERIPHLQALHLTNALGTSGFIINTYSLFQTVGNALGRFTDDATAGAHGCVTGDQFILSGTGVVVAKN